jgi:hypothetical protein
MPVFLSDPSPTAYAIVVMIVGVLAGIYLRSRKRKDLYPLIGGVAVLIAVFVIDRLVESPREEAMRRMQEMSAATANKKWDDVFKNISESFNYKGSGGGQTDKKSLREKVRSIEAMLEKGFVVFDFNRSDFKQIDDKNSEIGFRAQLKERPESVTYVKARFTKDPDGEWRMSGFDCYEPINTNERRTIPGLD